MRLPAAVDVLGAATGAVGATVKQKITYHKLKKDSLAVSGSGTIMVQ